MRNSEGQTGEHRRKTSLPKGGELPMLLLLLAIVSVTLISLASVRVATAATPALPTPPMKLPSDAGISGLNPETNSSQWIVGGKPTRRTDRLAKQFGATPVAGQSGSFRIAKGKARALADSLDQAGQLVYAEPDTSLTPSSYPLDRFIGEQWWLDRIVSPTDVTPPEVTASSPLIAVVEESLDPRHPDLVEANLTGALSLGPEQDTHGTTVASIIGSPGENAGIRGVWPGARMRLFPSGMTCSTASSAVVKAANRGAAVINMSYTFPAGQCYTHFKATQHAVKRGAVPVAASGNSGAGSNAPARPAVDPHVLTVGAVDQELGLAPFSTRNSAVDITAPGDKIFAPYVSKDPEGRQDIIRGWRQESGTSFAAPMVTAVAAWIKQVRPNLGNLQIAQVLMNSATDLGVPGRDSSFGEGLLSIERSLAAPDPIKDLLEPNDDIRWLNGSQFKPKAKFLWRPGKNRKRSVVATLSRAKDPADVYRVILPARSRVMVSAAQLEGDMVLAAYKPKTKSIFKAGRNLIVKSDRAFPKTEGILVRNRKRKRQVIWLAVTPSPNQSGNDSTYRIDLTRK